MLHCIDPYAVCWLGLFMYTAGILVCYCECDSPSVPVTAVSWLLCFNTATSCCNVQIHMQSAEFFLFRYTAGILMCYCEYGSPSVPVTAVSWLLSVLTQPLHAALYRSICSLLTCSCLVTLQGFYCVTVNVAVRLFQLLPSAECCQFQHTHFMLHCIDPYAVCWLGPV